MSQLIKISSLIILFLILNSFSSSSVTCYQIQENEFYFSINDVDNFIIKDFELYSLTGKFKINEKYTNINENIFDLTYKNIIIGRYSDSESPNSFCELSTNDNQLKKELGLLKLVSLKKIEEKELNIKVKNALMNYPLQFYKSPEILNNKGYFLYKYKYYYASLLYFNKVIEKFPTRAVAYLNIADCYWETNEKDKAIENYKKYIQLIKVQKKDLKRIPKYVLDRVK